MTTHLWIGARTRDRFGIAFTRTYGYREAADDNAYAERLIRAALNRTRLPHN